MTSPTPQALARGAVVAAAAGVAVAGAAHRASGFDALALLDGWTTCLFRAVTGAACPGCGMTRALLLLGQLRWREALILHPLAPMVVLAAAWILLGAPGRHRLRDGAALRLALALVIGIWVGRMATGTAPV